MTKTPLENSGMPDEDSISFDLHVQSYREIEASIAIWKRAIQDALFTEREVEGRKNIILQLSCSVVHSVMSLFRPQQPIQDPEVVRASLVEKFARAQREYFFGSEYMSKYRFMQKLANDLTEAEAVLLRKVGRIDVKDNKKGLYPDEDEYDDDHLEDVEWLFRYDDARAQLKKEKECENDEVSDQTVFDEDLDDDFDLNEEIRRKEFDAIDDEDSHFDSPDYNDDDDLDDDDSD